MRLKNLFNSAPLDSEGLLVSKKSNYFIYIKKILKINNKSVKFIDYFEKEKVVNIDKNYDFYDFHFKELKMNFSESELYKKATHNAKRESVYKIANYMAHGYKIHNADGYIIILKNKEKFLFFNKKTNEMWKAISAV